MDLSEIRKNIDDLDDQLLCLLLKRMECSRQVAEYKLAKGLEVLNAAREDEILKKTAKAAGEHKNAAELVFSAIMEASRALQHDLTGGGNDLRELLIQGLAAGAREAEKSGERKYKIVCQGIPGAYSGEAAELLYPGAELHFVESFEDVFEYIRNGGSDFAVIPVENSTAGSVTEVYDLLLSYKYYVNQSVDMKISHCLLGVRGASISDLRSAYSHPQGLLQCSDFLKKQNICGVPWINTAAAALCVSEGEDLSRGAIASGSAAGRYGLDILAENIQNSDRNRTRFISVSKELAIASDADKISLSFSLPHKTGSLYRILARFSAAGLNLTKIESRPYKSQDFEYLFYLDFLGNIRDENTVNTLCALSEELPDFAFLGNYKSL